MITVKKKELLKFLGSLLRDDEASVMEGIDPFAGDVLIIDKGLKLRHKDSKIVYTVRNVLLGPDGEPKIYCHRLGKRILILPEDFNDYERL